MKLGVLTDKLEGIEVHKQKWKNDFCGKVHDPRQEFKETRNMSFIRLTNGSKGTRKTNFTTNTTLPRRVSTTRKTNGRVYQQPGKHLEVATASQRKLSQNTAKKRKGSCKNFEQEDADN